MTDHESEREGCSNICHNFANHTSFHGVPWIGHSKKWRWKLFWTFVFLACLTTFLVQFYYMIVRYLRYEKMVEVLIRFENIPFPAVTFCNMNPYKKSSIERFAPQLNNLLQVYQKKASRPIESTSYYKLNSQLCDSCSNTGQLGCHPSTSGRIACDCIMKVLDGVESIDGSCHSPLDWLNTKCLHCDSKGRCETPKILHLNLDNFRAQIREQEQARLRNLAARSYGATVLRNVKLHRPTTIPPPTTTTTTPNEPSNYNNNNTTPCICSPAGPCFLQKHSREFATVSSRKPTKAQVVEDDEEDQFGYKGIDDKSVLNQRATINMMFEVQQLPKSVQADLSYTKEEQIHQCSFSGAPCDMQRQFRQHIDPKYGNCYTFNWEEGEAQLTAARPGALWGLRLLIYANGSENLETTHTVGTKMMIHDPFDYPFPDTFGFTAPTGFLTSFAIRMQKVVNLPYPYGKCRLHGLTSSEKGKYLYGNQYTLEGCHRSCIQHQLIKSCGCADASYPVPEGSRICPTLNKEARKCLDDITYDAATNGNQTAKCSCSELCERNVFSVSFSAGQWPTEISKSTVCPDFMPNCTRTYREEASFMEIYYEQVNYQMLRELPAYKLINLLSDFGGLISLWVGFSVITGIETVVLIYDLISFFCCGWIARNNSRRSSEAPMPIYSQVNPPPKPKYTQPHRQNRRDIGAYYDGSGGATVRLIPKPGGFPVTPDMVSDRRYFSMTMPDR